jgi:hypothetical protein
MACSRHRDEACNCTQVSVGYQRYSLLPYCTTLPPPRNTPEGTLLVQLVALLQLLAPIEELEDEDKEVDDVQVELDRGHDVVIGAHPVVDHVRVCRRRGRAKVSTAAHRRQIQRDTQAGMRVSRFGARVQGVRVEVWVLRFGVEEFGLQVVVPGVTLQASQINSD